MSVVQINLTKQEMNKLMKGKTAQLKHASLINGTNNIELDKSQLRRYKRALKNNTGFRLKLSNEQISKTMTGEGVGDFFKKLKEDTKEISKNVYKKSVKPTLSNLKKSAKEASKSFLIETLGKEKPLKGLKESAKERAKTYIKEEALPEIRRGAKDTIDIAEKEVEQKLIDNYNVPENVARAVVTASSVRMSNATKEELDAVEESLNGMGLYRNVHYTYRKGKGFSFKKIWSGIKKGFNVVKPVLSAVARPLAQAGLTALTGNPATARMIMPAIDAGLKKVGMGAKKSKKGTQEMMMRMEKVRMAKKNKGGALFPLGGKPKSGKGLYAIGRGSMTKEYKPRFNQSVDNPKIYKPNPISWNGEYIV